MGFTWQEWPVLPGTPFDVSREQEFLRERDQVYCVGALPGRLEELPRRKLVAEK
jgi:hypothetical protein